MIDTLSHPVARPPIPDPGGMPRLVARSMQRSRDVQACGADRPRPGGLPGDPRRAGVARRRRLRRLRQGDLDRPPGAELLHELDHRGADDHDHAAHPVVGRCHVAVPDHHRRHLTEVRRRVATGARVRAEHDVPPHHDGVRPQRQPREDDPRHRGPHRVRDPRAPGSVEGGTGRGRVHPRRHARVRVELLDVRPGLRPGGQRRLPGEQQHRPELPLPHQHQDARDRRRRARRQGPEVRRRHPRRPLRAGHQLVQLRPQHRRRVHRPRGEAHPARALPARHRDHAGLARPRTSR